MFQLYLKTPNSDLISRYQISTINEENDLGINFSHDFKFRSHIHKIIQKANKILGIIKHTFKYLEPDIMRLLYHVSGPSIPRLC